MYFHPQSILVYMVSEHRLEFDGFCVKHQHDTVHAQFIGIVNALFIGTTHGYYPLILFTENFAIVSHPSFFFLIWAPCECISSFADTVWSSNQIFEDIRK